MKKLFHIPIFLFVFLFISLGLAAAQEADGSLFRNFTEYEKVLVVKVISADTVELQSGEKIKLIGLKAPNPPKKERRQINSYGYEILEEDKPFSTLEELAFGFAKELLEDKFVRIEFDRQKRDEDLTTLGYVFLPDGTFVNAEILRKGFANLQISPLNKRYIKQLREAYQEARKEKRGLQGE